MKTQFIRLLAVLTAFTSSQCAFAQGTAFTYQGRLFDNTNPANGNYALKFTLYSDATTGMPALAGPVIVAPVAASNGLFTVLLDFGSNPNSFTGPARWLQIDSASNTASPIFIPMNPRQQLTSAPYAIFAATASNLSGTLPTGQLSGTVLNNQLANNGITINPGAGLSGGGVVALGGSTSLAIPTAGVINTMLANPTLTVSAGTGLSGGGSVALGGTTTLSNTGVLSVSGNADITATNVSGTVTLGDTATSANTPNTIVKRDGAGGISVGTVTGNGSGLTNVNAMTVAGLNANNFWHTTGNSGTDPNANFLGTTDGVGLVFRANNARGLRLDSVNWSPNPGTFLSSINLNGGFGDNTIAFSNPLFGTVLGGTIAGGGYSLTVNLNETDYPNKVNNDFGTVGGGYGNTAGLDATVPGGYNNSATGDGSFAAGRNAQTTYAGDFVWSDGTQTFNGSGINRFEVLASNGVLLHTAGGNGLVVTSGGNVGINTATPIYSLEVSGQFMVADGLAGEHAYIGGSGTGLLGGGGPPGNVQIGSLNQNVTAIDCYNAVTGGYMHLNCSSITIEGGSDLAEPFQISAADQEVPQGAVVVIDEENPGHLKLSDRPYDTRVAGVISGANGIHPGIQMQQQGLLEGGKNVALTGRVYVQADASNGAIRPGDLLTTSTMPGHAMRVTDHTKAQGAILGKAMTGLKKDQGTVLVLVTLQ